MDFGQNRRTRREERLAKDHRLEKCGGGGERLALGTNGGRKKLRVLSILRKSFCRCSDQRDYLFGSERAYAVLEDGSVCLPGIDQEEETQRIYL